MADPRTLPLADEATRDKYMKEAGEFILNNTSIAEDSMTALKNAGFSLFSAITSGQLTMYMSIFAVAEFNAQKDGLTLRDYAMAEAMKKVDGTLVTGPETRQ